MNDPNSFYFDPKIIDFLSKRGEKFEDVLNRILTLGLACTSVKGLQEVVYRYHLIGETGSLACVSAGVRKNREQYGSQDRDNGDSDE